jgi:hypothetical protein
MTPPRRRGQSLATRLGLFAVLFQAILFGWHHHDLIVAGRLPALVIEKPDAAPQVIDDEDGCEICQVLHHLTAAPVDVAGAPPPLALAIAAAVPERASAVRGVLAGFHARAPPSA